VRRGSGGFMRKHVFGAAAMLFAAVTAAPAFAADLPAAPQIYAPPPAVVPAPVYSWTGCYLGIAVGGAVGQSQHVSAGLPNPATTGFPITNTFDVDGGVFGGTVGCNYQISAFVIGVENDMSWTNITGSGSDIAPFNLAARSTTSQSWLDTLRGRAGVVWDRYFLYGTGGAAFSNVGVSVCNVICVSDSQTRTGWVAGVGAEWAAWTMPAGTLTLKVEYLHADFGSGRFVDPPVVGPTSFTAVTRNVKLTDEIFRAGVNWKFNWP
jgi:outer membrane immunogenic protein